VNLWSAPGVLASDRPLVEVKALLRFGSLNFPPSHGEQEDGVSWQVRRFPLPGGACVAVPVRAPAAAPATGQLEFHRQ